MSKAYRGKTCVYCVVEGSSTTGDHVVAREFFPKKLRGNLPKVPACTRCNGEKSKLEHYLTTIIPFGSNHADAVTTLVEMVPPRLAKNQKLQQHLRAGMRDQFRQNASGIWTNEMALPLEGESLERLLKMIGQGLCFFHWGLLLDPSKFDINGGFLLPAIEQVLEAKLNRDAEKRVQNSLGGGIFTYEGAQVSEAPEITIWRMSLCGVVVRDDQNSPHVRASRAYLITAKKGKRCQ